MAQLPGKYQRLAGHLATQEGDQLTLTFAEIERIMRGALPATAYSRTFWTNNPHGRGHPSRALSSAGWHVVTAELWRRRITFGRMASAMLSPSSAADCNDR